MSKVVVISYGAMVPHGMIQPGPDTRIDGWDSCSGYYYEDTTINGFAHTRLSGTCDPVQYAVFIDPPLAHIGISEEEALKRGYSFKVSRLPASSIVRTRTLRQTDGMLKAIINNHNGKIMGCTLFCADASEIINIVAMAIKTGQTSTFLRDFIFTHPSMSEGLNQLFDV